MTSFHVRSETDMDIESVCTVESPDCDLPTDFEVDVDYAQRELCQGAITPYMVEKLVTARVTLRRLPQELVNELLRSSKPCKVTKVIKCRPHAKLDKSQQLTQHSDGARFTGMDAVVLFKAKPVADGTSDVPSQGENLPHQYDTPTTLPTATYHCALCDTTFVQLFEFLAHLKIHNADITWEPVSSHQSATHDATSIASETYKYFLSGDQSHGSNAVVRVLDIPIKQASISDQPSAVSSQEGRPLGTKSKYPAGKHRCSFCVRNFSTRALLLVHEQIHKREKPYKCFICQMPFSQKIQRALHEFNNSKDEPIKFHLCQKHFYLKNALQYQ